MSDMSISAIQSTLEQLNNLASQASGSNNQATNSLGQGGFSSELQASIRRINQLQQTAETQAQAFQAGDPNVALNDVMVDMQKADVAFQMGVQVRNRLVGAYKEIMNMQV